MLAASKVKMSVSEKEKRTPSNLNVSGPLLGSIGSFSIKDRDGSESVTLKMNSCIFKLCRVYCFPASRGLSFLIFASS